VPIRNAGGLAVGDDRIVPRPLLVGRDPLKLAQIGGDFGGEQGRGCEKAKGDDSNISPRRHGPRKRAIQ